MTYRPPAEYSDHELADAWIDAYREWSKDYRNREARALVDALTVEMRSRGYIPPRERVAAEVASIAAQLRAKEVSIVPEPPVVISKRLEDDLMNFIAAAKRGASDR
jgi:hypothetical protein